MNLFWIELADGGLVRSDAVLLVIRTDTSPTQGETPAIVTQTWHILRPRHEGTTEDLAEKLREQGLPLLRCLREKSYSSETGGEALRTIWVNLDRVQWASPKKSGGATLLMGLRPSDLVWVEVEEPAFAQVAADLRYFLEKRG